MACAQAVAAVAIRGAPTTGRLHPAATRDLPPLHIPHMANDEYDPVLANPGTTRLVPEDAVAACGREGIVKHTIPQSKVHAAPRKVAYWSPKATARSFTSSCTAPGYPQQSARAGWHGRGATLAQTLRHAVQSRSSAPWRGRREAVIIDQASQGRAAHVEGAHGLGGHIEQRCRRVCVGKCQQGELSSRCCR